MRIGIWEIAAILVWILLTLFAFNPLYYYPEAVRVLFDSWGWKAVPEMADLPTLFAIVIILNPLYIIFEYAIIYLRITSSIIVGEGMDSLESCDSSDIQNQMNADFAYIKTGGTKDIPVKGPHVWINPRTHIHKYGEQILLFTGNMIPNRDPEDVPFGIKNPIRARRKSDFFTLKDASIGYFTPDEETRNIRFNYKQTGRTIDTKTFLENLRILNREHDVALQENEGETDYVSRRMKAHTETGKSLQGIQKKPLLEQVGLKRNQ